MTPDEVSHNQEPGVQAVDHAEGVHGACFHPLAKGHSHQGQSLVSGFRKKGENKLNLLKERMWLSALMGRLAGSGMDG